MPNNKIPQKQIDNLDTTLSAKQNTLTAGDNVTIASDTISVTIPYATANTVGGVKLVWDSTNAILNIITE